MRLVSDEEIERTVVVFLPRVVVLGEIVEGSDTGENADLRPRGKCVDPASEEYLPALPRSAKGVVLLTDTSALVTRVAHAVSERRRALKIATATCTGVLHRRLMN